MPRNPTVSNCKTIRQWDGLDYRIERVSLFTYIYIYMYYIGIRAWDLWVFQRTRNPTRFKYTYNIYYFYSLYTLYHIIIYEIIIQFRRHCSKRSNDIFFLQFFRYSHTHTHCTPTWPYYNAANRLLIYGLS